MVIYVDRNNVGLNGIAQALGGALGQGLTARYQQNQQAQMGQALQQALQQAQGMPPDQQAPFMMSKLSQFGPQGKDFVDLYMKMQEDATKRQVAGAQVAQAQAQTQSTQTLDKLNQFRLAHAGEEQRLEDEVNRAKAAQLRATAAGDYAHAASEQANAALAEGRLAAERREQAIVSKILPGLLGGLGGDQAQAPAPGQGKPLATPESYTPGGAGGTGATLQRISGPATASQGGENSSQDDTSNSPENILALIEGLSRGVDPIKAIPQVTLTPDERAEIMMEAASGNPDAVAKALKTKREMLTPTIITETQFAPGVQGRMGLVNGEMRWIPGSLQYKPGKVTDTLLRMASGATLFQDSNEIMKAISAKIPEDGTDDPLGDTMLGRTVNNWLINHNLAPMGGKQPRTLFEAYKAIYDYHVMGISLMLPAQRSQTFLTAIKLAAPMPTEPQEVRNQKMKATELTADLIISNAVKSAVASGTAVPPDLMAIFKDRGLAKTTPKKLRQAYLDSFDALGITPPALPLDDAGGGAPAQERGAPGNGGVDPTGPDVPHDMPSAQVPRNDGWTFTPLTPSKGGQ